MTRPRLGVLSMAAAMLIAVATIDATADESLPVGAFAVIDGETIGQEEFETYFARYARSKLYHGGSAERLAELRREAVDLFVEQRLMLREAERRGIAGDEDAADAQITKLRARYETSEEWAQIEADLPKLRSLLVDMSKISTLEESVRFVPEPSPDALVAYYEANPEKFTLPTRHRLQLIMLGVPPSAGASEWQAAKAKADELREQVATGEDFAEMAREHSNHESAENGGDMGVVHEGELTGAAQKAIDALSIGEISAPVRVLEGIVLFKLIARMPPELLSLDEVRERALSLYLRDEGQQKWDRFLSTLRGRSNVTVNEQGGWPNDGG